MAARLETRSDCGRCAALCCIAYPSEDMPGFAASKQAGEACPKLDDDGRCTIYERREEAGFSGCIRFECFGAGQHVVEHLFKGRDWREDPVLLRPMVEAFLAMRPVSDLAFLVSRALQTAPAERVATELVRLQEELADIGSSLESLAQTGRVARAQVDVRRVYAEIDPDAVK